MEICELSSKYIVRKMTPADIDIIYDLSVGNPIFYKYCPPNVTRDNILSDMNALPPHCTKDDKYYIGFFEENKLIAIMDLIIGFPKKDIAYIGLFMVDRKMQGIGIGSQIVNECLSYLKNNNIHSVQLAFAKGNPQSKAFWKKNGFVLTGTETDHGVYFSVSMEKVFDNNSQSKRILAKDQFGNQLVEFIQADEASASTLYKPITVCLVVVKIGDDYLFGLNHWRKCWEIFGGCVEKGETLRQTIMRECKEELGLDGVSMKWLGLARFYLQPDYFSPAEREEFGGIFGITLSETDLQAIEQSRIDREEIERISLLKDIPETDIVSALDKKLTEYYS